MSRIIASLILLAWISAAPAQSFDYPGDYPGNRYQELAESLFEMMDAFASAYQRNRNRPDIHWPNPTPPPYWQPGSIPDPNPLSGNWQGMGGEVMVIRGERFRLYADRQNYREGLIQPIQPGIIALTDPATGISRPYEAARSGDRLALRDPQGTMLLFRLISP